MDFDLESLVNVEQTFYDDGFKDGFNHGRIHGLIEGRALGREKGFEMWEELGFYEGFALTWKAIHLRHGGPDDRTAHHIRHLLELIAQFPRVNPRADDASELDIPRLFRQIRSRYKALCATLGVRPILRAAAEDSSSSRGELGDDIGHESKADSKEQIWPIQHRDQPMSGEELSF